MTTYFRAAEFPFDKYPHLRDWYDRIESLDAWAATEAELWRSA